MEKMEKELVAKNYDSINFNYLKFFIEAAEANNLQEVADKLGYELSNVSASLTNFEKQLGVKLFTRNPLKLTEIGRDIYETVKKGYRDIEFANIIARSSNNIECGKISIGCPLNIAESYLISKMSEAIKKYPNLQIKLDCETDYKKIVNKIRNNSIQFAILDFIPVNNEILKGFEMKTLFDSEYILVSNEEKEIKEIKELENYKYITSEDDRYTTINLRKRFSEYDIELNQSIICVITEARIEAAKKGLGLAYVIKDSVRKELENGELYEVKVPIELPKTTVNIIYLKDRLTKVDKEFIKEYLK